MRGMLDAIAAWSEVADVCMYERTVCPVFETKSSSNPGRSIRRRHCYRMRRAPTPTVVGPRDVRRVHPRAILVHAARTCRT